MFLARFRPDRPSSIRLCAARGWTPAVYRDYKTAVQEVCQIRFRDIPRYILISETGPDHDKRFETSLVIGERVIASGTGRNKKEAEQQAAKSALEVFEAMPNNGSPRLIL
jgi:dsRNA-specific ribonuclease